MAKRRVLVIAYYFPPLGGGGVQRALNFIRYLPDFDWQPVVLTVDSSAYPVRDESLCQQVPHHTPVIRTPALGPTDLYFRMRRGQVRRGEARTGPESVLPGWARRAGRFAVQAAMLPDDRATWAWSAVRAGLRAIDEHGIDAIFSSAPPFTAHQIGWQLARRTGRAWVADFRDQFVGRYNEAAATPLHRWIGRRMERRWVTAARRVISTTWRVSADFAARYPELPRQRWETITNGYVEGDFDDNRRPPESHFCLRYLGSLYRAGSPSLEALLSALAHLVQKRPDLRQRFRLEFIGMRDIQASQGMGREIRAHGLQEIVTCGPPVPHEEAIAAMQSATALLLLLTTARGAAGIIPAKTFEYLRAGRPILALVPPGETADLVDRLRAGAVAHPEDVSQIETALGQLIDNWQRGTLAGGRQRDVEQFERRTLTGRLAAVLDEVTAERQG